MIAMIDLKKNALDFSKIEPPKVIECDVVIVGSGAGGGIAAEVLSRSGLKVLILEEGPLKTASDFKLREKEAYADLYQEVAGRQTLDKGIQILQGRTVGGSTTVNWTSSFRTPKQTLDYWQSEFAIKGLASNDLSHWFDWVEHRLNISQWLVPPNSNNQLLADGATQLGWSHSVIPRNVTGCANLGYCGMGCPLNAKQSMLVTCIPKAVERGAILIHRVRAESVIHQNGKATGVWLSSMSEVGQIKQKNITKVVAKQVVLSAGAIGSPAILMRSKIEDPYNTLGKRTFLHPVTASIARMHNKVDAFAGAPQSIYSDQFLWRDGVSGELGYKIEVPPMHPVLSSTLLLKHGSEQQALMQDFAYYQANIALVRDGFHPDSQGGQVVVNKNGYPHLDYKISNTLWRALKHALKSTAELQFAAGANNVLPLHLDAKIATNWQTAQQQISDLTTDKLRWQTLSAHVMGGCGMGSNPQNSVVDSQANHHQLKGLKVIDGSLFPTSLGVNPQLTIYAIATKLAAQLAVDMKANLPDDIASLNR
jgi:choline dehydrogenase-like flavoprotein